LFTNVILPMRAGEVVRAYLVSRWLNVTVAEVVPSMVVERLFDGIWLALALGATAVFVERLPPDLLRAGDFVGVGVVAAMLIVHLGTMIPNAPANVGTYQFFAVAGLELFGVDKSVATGFSLVVFFLLTLPLWLLGSLAVSRSGMTLAGVRAQAAALGAGNPVHNSGTEFREP
jgi:uncharacterized membrane protein YbhN (UPF0104 family)